MQHDYDIIICGAGPGGSGCALALAESGVRIALVDKAVFPRDKICGDGLTHEVIWQFDKLPLSVQPNFQSMEQKHPFTGVRVFAPDGTDLAIPMKMRGEILESWFVQRKEFDNFLFTEATRFENVTAIQDAKVEDISYLDDGVEVVTSNGTFTAKMVVGADGAQSVVARTLTDYQVDHKHHAAGLRRYFENVEGVDPHGYMEIHFCEEIQPGYFWIFPLPDNRWNVGLGMLSSTRKKTGIKLREAFDNMIANNPQIAPKFKNAKPLEPTRGWGLPLGTQKRPISGERFVLVGDAAGLIDPFTGEGVANAIRSGRFAAPFILKALEENDFSAASLSAYDKRIHTAMDGEFKRDWWVQRVQERPKMLSWVIRKLANNPSGQKWLKHFIEGEKLGAGWFNPWNYFRMLWD